MTVARITVTLARERAARLRQIAGDSGLSLSKLIDLCVEEALHEPTIFLARVMTHRQEKRYNPQAVASEEPLVERR